jgi:hypothetical protein
MRSPVIGHLTDEELHMICQMEPESPEISDTELAHLNTFSDEALTKLIVDSLGDEQLAMIIAKRAATATAQEPSADAGIGSDNGTSRR